MPRKLERKSRMTPEALKELGRRHKAGEDMRGPFSLTTGRPDQADKSARMKRIRVVTYKMVKVSTPQVERPYVLFGEFVRDARHDWGWTQLELAEKTSYSRGTIANIETGRQRVLLTDVLDFAKVLKVDPVKIFTHIMQP